MILAGWMSGYGTSWLEACSESMTTIIIWILVVRYFTRPLEWLAFLCLALVVLPSQSHLSGQLAASAACLFRTHIRADLYMQSKGDAFDNAKNH